MGNCAAPHGDGADPVGGALLARLGSQTVAYALPSVVGAVVGFAALPVYTRWLSPTEYGHLSVSLAVGRLAFTVFHLGVFAALARQYFELHDARERGALVGNVLAFPLLWGGGLSVTLILALWTAPAFPAPWPGLLSIALANAFLLLVPQVTVTLLTISGLAWRHAAISAAQTVVAAGFALVLVTVMGGARSVLLGTAAANGVALGLHLAHLLRRWRPALDRSALVRCVSYGLPVQVVAFGWWALGSMDRIMLTWLSSAAAAGVYASAAGLVMPLNVFSLAFNQAWTIYVFRVAARDTQRLTRDVSRAATYFALILGSLMVVLLVYVDPVAAWVIGPAFQGARRLLPLLAPAAFLSGLYFIPSRTLFERHRHHRLGAVFALAVGIEVLCLAVLVPGHGETGAAIASFVGNAVMLALTYRCSQRLMPVPYEWRRLARIGGGLVLTVGALIALRAQGGDVTFVTGTLVALAFPVMLLISGFLRVEERAWLRRLLGRA